MRKLLIILTLCILLSGCSIVEPVTEPDNSVVPSSDGTPSTAAWEDFINNDLKTAEYKGDQEWKKVSFSNFDSFAEYDIDNDGDNELILRYSYLTYDYGDMETTDFAYIILKNSNGDIVEIADFWNSGGLETNILRYNGRNLFVITSKYAVVATRYKVLTFSEGKFIEQFSYTEYYDAEDTNYVTITQENGIEYASLSGEREKYLGNNFSTSDSSIKNYEELLSRINGINAFPEVEFSS